MPTYIDCYTADGCFVPYVRMTQRGKFVQPRAQEYLDSQMAMGLQFKTCMKDKMIVARRKPLSVAIYIFHDHGFNNRDLDNEVKAILDAAQGIVFEDDRWIDHLQAFRRRSDRCRVGLWVKVIT